MHILLLATRIIESKLGINQGHVKPCANSVPIFELFKSPAVPDEAGISLALKTQHQALSHLYGAEDRDYNLLKFKLSG